MIALSGFALPGTVIGVFSASQNGVLAYQTGDGDDGSFRLVWRDRDGTELEQIGELRGSQSAKVGPHPADSRR